MGNNAKERFVLVDTSDLSQHVKGPPHTQGYFCVLVGLRITPDVLSAMYVVALAKVKKTLSKQKAP